MKRFIVLILFFCLPVLSSAQANSYLKALEKFQEYYNLDNGKAAFELLDTNMQHKIGVTNLSAMVSNFNTNYGTFKNFKFTERRDAIEEYHGIFEKGELRIFISLDSDEKITGLLFKDINEERLGKFDRNTTKLQLPFKGEWFTFWGGEDKRQNYHVVNKTQKGAFDFIVLDKDDNAYTRSGTRNEDYYAFGKPLYAVCDAIVYSVTTGVPDNRPTIMNPAQLLGNSVVLKTMNNEYIVYAHFEFDTVKLKAGDVVKKGQFLGNCGNSGNSSQPHLHLHIQDGPNLLSDIGVRCYFEEVLVNGEIEKDYSPVKTDRVSMVKK